MDVLILRGKHQVTVHQLSLLSPVLGSRSSFLAPNSSTVNGQLQPQALPVSSVCPPAPQGTQRGNCISGGILCAPEQYGASANLQVEGASLGVPGAPWGRGWGLPVSLGSCSAHLRAEVMFPRQSLELGVGSSQELGHRQLRKPKDLGGFPEG